MNINAFTKHEHSFILEMETHTGICERVVQGVVRQQCWIVVDSVQRHPHSCDGS